MDLIEILSDRPHTFLQPPAEAASSAVALAKSLLDPLAEEVANAQIQRRDEGRKKRKRRIAEPEQTPLQLRTVYTKGLAVKQVWEQARRVLDAACLELEQSLPKESLNEQELHSDNVSDDEDMLDAKGYEDMENASDDAISEDERSDDIDHDQTDVRAAAAEDEEEDYDDDEVSSVDPEDEAEPETFVQDPNGLNDGFFSIDNFNRQSQFLEQMDARGDEDNPSDEDEVDWDADPMGMPITTAKPNGTGNGKSQSATLNDDADDDDDAGPTFGNADLDASESDEEADGDDGYLDEAMPGLSNTNEIRYTDFFEPPPKRPSKTKRMRALPKTQPPKQAPNGIQQEHGEDSDGDLQRAMNDVQRDIFASESEASEGDAGSDSDAPITRNMSTHEKQRAKIAAEIRRLEAANVAKRDWTLSGEARAVDRPMNSLIEEDLEFERVGKPVPVITAEVSEEIEQLIKRRIIAREFDEVIRRRPDAIGSASDARRGRVEVDDRKSQTGLADIYEQEHLRATDPGYVDKRSTATKKQHAEIDRLWKEVSYQLDLLSNLHFKPKRIEAEIKTVEDKPKISMEDARPVGEGVGADESMLAPQEVYRAGEIRKEGELSRKGGASINREEMSREEKLRKRRRQKERIKKNNANRLPLESKRQGDGKKSKGEEKQDILSELKKGNVKVIDKKGDLQNLGKQGHIRSEASSSALKL